MYYTFKGSLKEIHLNYNTVLQRSLTYVRQAETEIYEIFAHFYHAFQPDVIKAKFFRSLASLEAESVLSRKPKRLIILRDLYIIDIDRSVYAQNELLRFAFASLGHRKHVLGDFSTPALAVAFNVDPPLF